MYREKSSSAFIDPAGDPFEHARTDPQVVSCPQRRSRSVDSHWKIPPSQGPTVRSRIEQGESLRQIGREYGVSCEAVRRVIRAARHW